MEQLLRFLYSGVEAVALDADRDLVTVTGRVNEEKLVSYLQQKLKREIVVVLPAGQKNDKETAAVADIRDTIQKPKISGDNRGSRNAKEEATIATSQKTGQETLPKPVKVNEKETGWSPESSRFRACRESNMDINMLSFREVNSLGLYKRD